MLQSPYVALPTTELPVVRFNRHRAGITRANLDCLQRPTGRFIFIPTRPQECRRFSWSQRHVKLIQRERQTNTLGFDESFFACPATTKCLMPRVRWKLIQTLDFSGREESPRDVVTRKLRPNVFEVNADIPDRGEGIEGESTRMRQVEFQLRVLTGCRCDLRLAV